ncbi:histidine--tRNA ligase [Leeia aquatica]|uniref:Histidine--tRNA ligase n=1 Tax=Leeia aquatica TaxID=2725557 RepID=A0A847S6L4_9NEIS|nr:histidine--tRNA ligase [Leeia aquatica]NLR75403.1 histidine--tRNA ligase [Leeia aquatica]
MAKTLQAVKGMNDILPVAKAAPEFQSARWEALEAVLREWLHAYGYRNIRTPIVEPTELFVRSIGEVTDIVEKEMYTFTDQLNGDSLTLRPEGTASCLRAVLEHNLLYDSPQRLWYAGPMFRHERPQRGRYRQFHQVGVEALGYAGPDMDAEQIIMLADLWQRLGLTGMRLQLNTLGEKASRAAHREKLIAYLEAHQDVLDEEAKRRMYSNPLRVLDTKNPAMQAMVEAAPKLIEFLDDASLAHFDGLQARLKAAGVDYEITPRLVRGLDYYNLTVFEWVTDHLGAQSTVCGGGRYDALIEQMGGKPNTATGWGMGLERLLLILESQQRPLPVQALDAYLVHQGEAATALAWNVAMQLRSEGCSVQQHMGGGSFKSQMKKADQAGARFALIIGDEEAAAGQVTVKDLREGGEQQRVAVAAVAALLRSNAHD